MPQNKFWVRHSSDISKPGYWDKFDTLERAISDAQWDAENLGGEWEVVQKVGDDFEVIATVKTVTTTKVTYTERSSR
jgi:hypothetical protein